jgi:hypothetical protein
MNATSEAEPGRSSHQAANEAGPRHVQSVVLALIHMLASAAVVSLAWAQIERRLHREAVPFFCSYVVFSSLPDQT